jgi:hypothetical protein
MAAASRDASADRAPGGGLRTIHGLRDGDIAALAGLLRGSGWSLERHDGYDGQVTVLLVAAGPAGATPVVSRSRDGLLLHAHGDDTLVQLGCFASVEALVEAVLARAW